VTGASSGIGLELARCCAQDGWDLLLAADQPIEQAVDELSRFGGAVEGLTADLSTASGIDALIRAAAGHTVDALFANAGLAAGGAFVDQPFDWLRKRVDTNIIGTLDLVHRIGRDMRARGAGKILITGSIVGSVPGAYQAVYNGTKAFLNSFAVALRHELNDSGVTVTLLMPGATETEAFARGGLRDSLIGRAPKDDPAGVAQAAYAALLNGDSEIIPGIHNKLMYAAARVVPARVTAALHAVVAKPPR
jgi:short-subunit dehydrogenase